MNLDSGRVILDSYRVIGIKDSDKEKLIVAAARKESSFTPVQEPMIQDQPIVEVVPEIMPEVTPQVVDDVPVVTPVVPVEPDVVQTVDAISQQSSTNDTPEVNLFDIPVQEPVQSVVGPTVQEMPTPAPIPTAIPVESVMPNTVVNDEVQGGMQNTMSNELDTPQNFFEKVEQPASATVLTQEMVEANKTVSYSNDPAIIMLDNLREVVESKNEMIKALNEKINVLTEQVKNLEEARKVSEAQRVAAETTLAQARSAEMPSVGPTLTYQQPVQNPNYNQAA